MAQPSALAPPITSPPAPAPEAEAAERPVSRRREAVYAGLVVLAIVFGLLLRWNGALVAGDVADVSAYNGHVELTRTGHNVYTSDIRYPYFPGWLAVEMAAHELRLRWRMPLWLTIRAIIVVSDTLLCFAIWWVAARQWGRSYGRWAAVAYALNPIAVLISGYHGQFDALPNLFSVLGVGFLVGARPRAVPAGLLLGLAMALKPFPALLVPIFFRAPGLSLRGRVLVGGLSLAVVGGITAPYLLADTMSVVQNVGGYAGLNDQGLGGLMRALWLYRAHNIYLPGAFGTEITGTTKWLALAAIGLTFVLTLRSAVPRAAAAVYLAFLTFFGGVSTQYLVWPLPWLLISGLSPLWAVWYGLAAAAGAIGFYMVYWPQIILGSPWRGPLPENASIFLAGQAAAWIGIATTWIASVGHGFAALRRNRLALVALVLTVAAGYPFGQQAAWFVSEWLKWVQR